MVRDVLFQSALRVPEVGRNSVSGTVEANGASVKVVAKVHKVVQTFVRPMEGARDANGV